jgi:hypothetical protein
LGGAFKAGSGYNKPLAGALIESIIAAPEREYSTVQSIRIKTVSAPRAPVSGSKNLAPSAPTNKKWYWLLLLPYIAILWIPSYNRIEPTAFGVPFFYWYQLLWVGLSTLVIAVVFHFAHIAPQKSRKR